MSFGGACAGGGEAGTATGGLVSPRIFCKQSAAFTPGGYGEAAHTVKTGSILLKFSVNNQALGALLILWRPS